MLHQGEVHGFSVEVVQNVYASMGEDIISIRPYPWVRALSELSMGQADALFSANFSPERTVAARYPAEDLITSPWVVWSRQDQNLDAFDDLKGKLVGIVRGYSYTDEFMEFLQAHCKVVEVVSDEVCFRLLAAGRIDATVADLHNGRYLAEKWELEALVAHRDLVIKTTGLYAIFNKNFVDADFVRRFSRALKVFKQTEAYQNLEERYFGASDTAP